VLSDSLREAVSGRGGIVVVVSEPGLGKTRLISVQESCRCYPLPRIFKLSSAARFAGCPNRVLRLPSALLAVCGRVSSGFGPAEMPSAFEPARDDERMITR
jgi:hypothetical protein